MANRSGPPASPGNRGGNKSAGARSGAGARSDKLGQRSKGARGKGGAVDAKNITGGSGGPKKKSSSVMREATWNSMPKGQRLREHGTTSYAKYKADKVKMRANASSARSQRGGGGSRKE